jgi:hypothetical protein
LPLPLRGKQTVLKGNVLAPDPAAGGASPAIWGTLPDDEKCPWSTAHAGSSQLSRSRHSAARCSMQRGDGFWPGFCVCYMNREEKKKQTRVIAHRRPPRLARHRDRAARPTTSAPPPCKQRRMYSACIVQGGETLARSPGPLGARIVLAVEQSPPPSGKIHYASRVGNLPRGRPVYT